MDRLYTTYSERAELTIEEYAYLLSCKAQIEALRAGGVDNWEWYGESLKDAGYYKYAEGLDEALADPDCSQEMLDPIE